MTLREWNTVIDVNLTGQFLCAREAVRRFRTQNRDSAPARSAGCIIDMSSVHEIIPWAGHINYASSKGGVRMFTQSLVDRPVV
jgi:glucose 1-dehydrogenase